MGVKLGLDARLYMNSGTYASPTWSGLNTVRDLTLNLETGEADVSTRSNQGWQYLWVRFIDDEDATAKALIKRPIAAYVEQVYPYGNFANLGIGV